MGEAPGDGAANAAGAPHDGGSRDGGARDGGARHGVTVYTAIAGGYDVLLPRGAAESVLGAGARHVAFVDRAPRFSWGWEVRPLPEAVRGMPPRAAARWCKINAHLLLPEAAVSVWLDGNIRRIGPVAPLVAEMEAAGAALATFRHPLRSDVRAEAAACARLGRFDAEDLARIDAQLARYEALPPEAGLMETGVVLRDHRHPGLGPAMEAWWAELEAGTRRDQISLPWTLHASGLPALVWQWSYRDPNPHFRMVGRHQPAGGALTDLARAVEAMRDDGPGARLMWRALLAWRRLRGVRGETAAGTGTGTAE